MIFDKKALSHRCDYICDTIGSRLVYSAPADFGTWVIKTI